VGERHAREQDPLAARDGVGAQVPPPRFAQRVAREQALGHVGELAQDRERHHPAARVARDAEGGGHLVPPGAHECQLLGRLVAGHDRLERGAVVRAGGLHRVVLDRRGEERLADERLLDEVDHVRERGPARRAARARELAADLAPRRRAVAPVPHRVGRAQQGGHHLADGVMDDEALAPELDEGQRREPRERRLRRLVRQQRREQRERDAAQDGRRVERLARRRVEPVEVERRQLLHDRRQDRVLRRVRPLVERRRRELERQRMAAHEAVDPLGLRLVQPGPAEHLGRVGRLQRAERERPQQLAERRPPDGARRVAGGDHDARVLGQRGQEGQAQPPVEQAQALGVVDHQHHRSAGAVQIAPDGGEEALRRRLDLAAVDGDDRHAARGRLAAQRAEERGLARAGDAVDDDDGRRVVEQGGELVVAADDARTPLGQQRSQGPPHAVRPRGRARDPAPRRTSPRRAGSRRWGASARRRGGAASPGWSPRRRSRR
jgi:hypothetical protein